MKTCLILFILLIPTIGFTTESIDIQNCGKDCLELTTRGGPVYRIYGCGKLEKLEWKVLNENEEPLEIYSASAIMNDWLEDQRNITKSILEAQSFSQSLETSK